ncbi:MAG: NADPH-dependent 7-cyano-7-deazaguanine reductase QueF [Burkholderiaceae bacterium]
MNNPNASQLGKPSAYKDQYDASLLFPIARAAQRAEIGLTQTLPFFGADMWTAYELSWLNMRGKPQVAMAQFVMPAESPNIIESKSFKLYLNSFSGTKLADAEALRSLMVHDLSEAAGASVAVKLILPDQFDDQPIAELSGLSLDRLDIECEVFEPNASLLSAQTDELPVEETLTSNLLKSNCPVTGQPDWGSVQISYTGAPINQEGLLKYIISFRNHNDFHEHCVERMFVDIMARCKPDRLAVYARYTRRGGLDINPFRTSYPIALPPNVRNARQ